MPGQSTQSEANTTPSASDSPLTRTTRRISYRESEFRIISPHGNEDGHTRAANFSGFQASPKYKRFVELLYSNPDTPWRTEADVLRAFLDYGCEYFGGLLVEKGGKAARIIQAARHQIAMMNSLVDEAREANDLAESIDGLERQVGRLVEGGMRESAVGLVFRYRELARALQDRILKRKLVGDIEQRFGYLLKGNQGRKDHERAMAILDGHDADSPDDDPESE